MPTEVILPKVDMDMATGKIAKWWVAEGTLVAKGQVLFEMETDKAAMEVEAPAGGILARVTGREGMDVPVGQAVAWIYAQGEPLDVEPSSGAQPAPVAVADAAPAAPAVQTSSDVEPEQGEAVRATPLARRLARERNFDLIEIGGGGPRGRVTADDVLGFQPSTSWAPGLNPQGATWMREALGAIPIVLIHGFGSETASWRPLLTAFPRSAPILSIDLPGHGAALDITADGFEDLVAHVEETLADLGIHSAHLVGHSLGGAVAAAVAAGLAVEARSLMLIAPAGLGPEINIAFTESFAGARDIEALRAAMGHLVETPSVLSEGLVRATLQTRRDGRLAQAQIRLGGNLFDQGRQGFSVRARLESLTMPVKVVAGRQDRVIPPAHMLDLPGQIALHMFDGVGHMPQWEVREPVARLLDELFRSA